jgi:ribosomal protein L11 methyltransferase
LIRLAVRCTPEQADLVLAELTILAPNGVEEERGPGFVEYAIYGGEGELPELGDLDAAIAGGRVEVSATEIPDDWADRWRDFHKPLLVADRLWLRPSWEPEREGAVDVVVDPGQAFGTGAHPTTRLCLELLCELEAGGELVDLGSGSGVLAIAAAKLGWTPIRAYDHEPAAIEAASANASANGVDVRLERMNLREQLPELSPTVVANMTAPILLAVAAQMGERWREPEEGSADNSGEGPASPPPAPETVVCSGLLPGEVDGVAAAFGAGGLVETDRRQDGDWAALLLRRA